MAYYKGTTPLGQAGADWFDRRYAPAAAVATPVAAADSTGKTNNSRPGVLSGFRELSGLTNPWGGTPLPTAGRYEYTPTTAFDAGNWYTTPGLSFTETDRFTVPQYQHPTESGRLSTQPWFEGQTPSSPAQGLTGPVSQGGATGYQVTLPDWAVAAGFTDPRAFYETIASIEDPKVRAMTLATLQGGYAAKQNAMGYLNEAQTGVEAAYDAWNKDPVRLAALESLEYAASPGSRLISREEEQAQQLQMGQAWARADAQGQRAAARRGAGSGGSTGSRAAALEAIASAAGVGARGQIAAANEAARRQAAGTLVNYGQSKGALDLSYENLKSGILQHKTGLEQPVDWFNVASVDEARRQFDEAVEFAKSISAQEFELRGEELDHYIDEWEKAEARYLEENEYKWSDAATTLMGGIAGGTPGMVLSGIDVFANLFDR